MFVVEGWAGRWKQGHPHHSGRPRRTRVGDLKEGPTRRQLSTTTAERKAPICASNMARYLATIPREEHFGSGHNSRKHQRGQLWDSSRNSTPPYSRNKCLRPTKLPKLHRRSHWPAPRMRPESAQHTAQAGRESGGASTLRATTAAAARRAATSRSPRAWPVSPLVSSA